jgi:hypothetical protein
MVVQPLCVSKSLQGDLLKWNAYSNNVKQYEGSLKYFEIYYRTEQERASLGLILWTFINLVSETDKLRKHSPLGVLEDLCSNPHTWWKKLSHCQKCCDLKELRWT